MDHAVLHCQHHGNSVPFRHGGHRHRQGILLFLQDDLGLGCDPGNELCVLIHDPHLCGDDPLGGAAALFLTGGGNGHHLAADRFSVQDICGDLCLLAHSHLSDGILADLDLHFQNIQIFYDE